MFRVLLIFFLLLATVLPLSGADPSEQFLSAYQSYQQGEDLERSGNTSDAINKYRFAESLLLSISKNDPSWQKPVIEYRLKKTRESLDRLQGGNSDSAAPDTMLSTVPASDSSPATPHQDGGVHRSDPIPAGPSISITPPTGTSGQSGQGTLQTKSPVSPVSSAETRRLRQTIEDLKGQLQDANDALTAQKRRASDLENAEWVKKRSQLTGDLDVAKRRISDLERDLKSRDSWGSELKDLQRKLDDAVADKIAAEEQFQGSEKKLSDENTMLVRQLQDAQNKVVQTESSKQKIVQLNQDLDQEKEVVAQLQAKLDHSEQSSKESLAKNGDLQKKLAETTDKLALVTKEQEAVAPLHEKIKELQAKVDQESQIIAHDSSLDADVQVLEEDRNRLSQKVTALGAAAAEASKVKGLTAETDVLKKTVEDLKGKLEVADKELNNARSLAESSTQKAVFKAALDAKKIAEMEADRDVLQEDKERLLAKVAQASLVMSSLKVTADTVPGFKKDLEQLKNQLADNSKMLDQYSTKLADAQKEGTAVSDALKKKEQNAKNVTDLLTQQNNALQEQLKSALNEIANSVDHAPEASALQNQLKKLQEQVDLNAKNFAESQRQFTELAKAQPDQQKMLEEKQKALADAQNQASNLQAKLSDASQQISALKKQGEQGATRLKDLQDQLAERDAKISTLKKKKGNAADEQMVQENDLLRGIVLREIKDEAKKSQAHRLMEEELKRLNIQSDTIQQQMTELAAPAVELTPQERALFKDAQLVVSDQGGETIEASIVAPMTTSNTLGTVQLAGNASSNNLVSSNSPAGEGKSKDTNAPSSLPWQGKFKQLLSQAKDEFDRQDYLQAENTFQEALKLAPKDYFALSNYGVVEFQLGKMKEAEEALTQAAAQSNESSFALTTLGIVHYRQQRAQDAETVLRKAVTINDQDFTAHNYLGIVLAASGKGKAGESELMRAVEINPNYADAHFNLAVIYATGKPPAKMLAKKHYQKALELGSPPDPSLDHILQ